MDSQVVLDVSKTRLGDSTKAGIDAVSTKTPEVDQKTTDYADATVKKAARDKSAESPEKHRKPHKTKQSANHVVEEESSDSDSDTTSSTDLSPDNTDGFDSSSSEEKPKKKSKSKLRHGSNKKKEKPVKAKRSKKLITIPKTSSSESDSDPESSDSDLSVAGSSNSDSKENTRGSRKNHKKRQLHLLTQQQQQQDLTRLLLLQQQQQQQQQLPPPIQLYDPYQQYATPAYYGAPFGNQASNPLGVHLGLTSNYAQPPHLGSPLGGYDRGLGIRPPPPGTNNGLRRGRLHDLTGIIPDNQRKSSRHRRSKTSRLDFKRVDQVWDSTIHNYKLQDTAEGITDPEYEGYLFHVRRTFDWEGKYKQTVVDIKSKLLRDSLQEVIGDVKGVSLVEEVPKLDPNLLFLYLEDMRKHIKVFKNTKPNGKKKVAKKERRTLEKKTQQMKVLVKYLERDYESVKKSLHPLLENGLITFDFLWALWKPNTLAYATTYGSTDEPRVFKVEMAEKHFSVMKGDFYYYFEYDGKRFGFGSMADEIGEFRGARKITSLPVYPLQYHKNEKELRERLITRGKKFVALSGVQYKSYEGMAYYKKKKAAVKVNITGRIMIDPSIHRRINPNYPISMVRPSDHDLASGDEDSSSELDDGCGCGSKSESDSGREQRHLEIFRDEKGNTILAKSVADDSNEEAKADEIGPDKKSNTARPSSGSSTADDTDEKAEKAPPEFGDEEYLLASSVILGFAFAEKLWLEFTVSNVKEIQWNDTAYDSLVLEPKTKDIVKALVESHKYHAAESIDDVIQGKGKGLVAVLHGPPGTGKTLTAEGISELLKCPLYMVSAGELGTDSRFLETELQKILDICHAWGAILLLDEADVFLEKRNMHDIHRNALVSIFLRQLEYFQGILFLTTNRVETFDDAFQSRIHIALRYGSLDNRARKAILKIFIERVRVLEKIDLMPFTEEDFTALARYELNGRQIKNTVRTAQALAVNKREPLSMSHIRQVLEVQMSFDRDLKGGPGFQDAMRSYF
ncbi:aaa family ATPase [Grosmannia clavigera kw1407]|uniref:Aaa family ATPase n=1 Tax=Grosmannia clavigera (strain kw1407 / UAMH 11150) TaxID=655863 RepID=F0XCC9_GROCL|nr:aaa family ATPase [Grosmannia clavigera kw1407]EFX04446.1 aaa family ATPase [Grosmannia clavigera kw1407]